MNSIESLRGEQQTMIDKATSLKDEANRLHVSAANYSANGLPDRADADEKLALVRELESNSFEKKAEHIEQAIQKLQAQADELQRQIDQLQSQREQILGS